MVSLGAIGALLFIIMNLASRNGLLTFCLLGVFGAIVGLWNRNWGFKIVIVTAAIFAAGAAAYIFKDSPTVERFIYQTEVEGGGDRLDYWTAGISALHEEPVFGLGGDETSSIYAVGRYSPGVPDHVMHNTFIEALVEYGILGEIFFLTFVFTILWHAFKNLRLGLRINNMLICAPSVSYFISIFAGCFISRIWETTLWYHMTLVFAVYVLFCLPIEIAAKKRKTYLLHGLPDPLESPALAIPYSVS
jgi:O-antigen ligase